MPILDSLRLHVLVREKRMYDQMDIPLEGGQMYHPKMKPVAYQLEEGIKLPMGVEQGIWEKQQLDRRLLLVV